MRKQILLTGGSGFIGRNIMESALAINNDIKAPSSKELNLLDTTSVDTFFRNKTFDVILHAATKPGHRNAKDVSNLFYSNVRMFENLVRHRANFGKFINFGSGAIYDLSQNITNVTETDIFNNLPKDEHGFCKYVVAKRIAILENFVDLNVFGIFGKYEDWEIRFISNAICKAVLGLPITLRQNRSFSYLCVNDLMPVLDFFINNKAKYSSYNVVPYEKTELLTLAEIIKKISGKNLDIIVAKQGYGLDYTGDNSRLTGECKAISFTPLKDAILNLYCYYEENKKTIDKKLLLTDK